VTAEPVQDLMETFLSHLRLLAQLRCPEGNRPGWRWPSYEQLVLERGGEPVRVESLTLPAGMSPGVPKECYSSAYLACARVPGYRYVEGYAMTEGLYPIEHAWVRDTETGTLIDPTWASLTNAHKPTVYLGLEFSQQFLDEEVSKPPHVVSMLGGSFHRSRDALQDGLVFDGDGVVLGWA
jgi:hypothetical protein